MYGGRLSCDPPYICWKACRIWFELLWLTRNRKRSTLSIEVTGTWVERSVMGTVAPRATAVKGLLTDPMFSSSQRPSQPVLLSPVGSPDSQIWVERKWDRSGLGYPTPWTTATLPVSYSGFKPERLGLKPTMPSRWSTLSAGTEIFERLP